MLIEETVWNYLIEHIKNPYGVAGLMGNLFAESRFDPLNITKKAGKTKEEYVADIINGTYPKDAFVYDGVAFGIAQWAHWSRKEALWNYASGELKNIGTLDLQLRYLIQELPKYKTVWNTLLTANSVKEASDIVLERHEKPATINDTVRNKRTAYGEKYYKMFAKDISEYEPDDKKEAEDKTLYLVTTVNNLNVRRGNGKQYPVMARLAMQGTQVEYIALARNNWYAVKLPDGAIGWIDGTYLEEA